jgi:6-phosphogluconolactonase
MKSLQLIGTVVAVAFIQLSAMVAAAADSSMWVYIGTYTGRNSQGIYVAKFDPATGKLGAPELAATTQSPSFVAVHPNHRWLYAANEVRVGQVSGFSIDEQTGKLTALNQQPSGGDSPCHLSVDKSGKCLLVANYNSGSIAAFPIGPDGKLGEAGSKIQHQGSSVDRQRQSGPHAHFIATDPANQFVLVCDLGMDKVMVYRLDPAKALLTPNDPPSVSIKAGSGPRHFVFSPNGQFVYVISEMAASMTALSYDAKAGALKELGALSTLPADSTAQKSCAEVQISASGKFVYGSNRGHDSIVVYSTDPSGNLTLVQHQPTQGRGPRHFALDPSGKWLLAENQNSGNVVVFSVDGQTGKLTPTEEKIAVGSPVCIEFVPAK